MESLLTHLRSNWISTERGCITSNLRTCDSNIIPLVELVSDSLPHGSVLLTENVNLFQTFEFLSFSETVLLRTARTTKGIRPKAILPQGQMVFLPQLGYNYNIVRNHTEEVKSWFLPTGPFLLESFSWTKRFSLLFSSSSSPSRLCVSCWYESWNAPNSLPFLFRGFFYSPSARRLAV